MLERENCGPLKGLRVLDLTHVLSGPYASMWLAIMGAEVIKIENPLAADVTHEYAPFINGKSAYYPTINRNKKGVTLNLKKEEGKKLFLHMVSAADVVLENYKPGVMDRLGLGYEKLRKVNPSIIYASISGYGAYGPYKDRPGYDVIAQSMSGIMYLTGQKDAPPTRVGSAIGDTVAGITILVAILAAIYCRNVTGYGQMVETALVDSLISLSTQDYIRYFAVGDVPRRMGNIYKLWTPYGTYKTKDGYYSLGCGTEEHFKKFAGAIGKPELADEQRFCCHAERVVHRGELDSIINEWASDRTVGEICDLMVKAGVPAAPVNSIAEISQNEHIAGAREMFPFLEQDGVGTFKVTNIPVRFSRSGLCPPSSAPELGADNTKIYKEFGLTDEEIHALSENGVI